jgi:hypothetical protein
MGCFKQVWSSFWRKNQGIGMIETAILLPIFLMFAFAVIDFGNYLIVKQRIVSANQAIASAIQNNPTMTTSATWGAASDLQTVIQNSLGDLWFNASGDYIGYTGVSIWASQTPPSLSTAPSGPGMWTIMDITNPWLSDGDPSNDNNAYYVGVRLWRGVPFLTPLPKLLGFASGVTPNFGDSAESQAQGAPHGRIGAESFTFVTVNGGSCPADQVLQSMAGGVVTCVPRDNNYSCPSGQSLRGIINGLPYCQPGLFGGVFTNNMSGYCLRPNPRTGGCSCPSGTSAYVISEYDSSVSGDGPSPYCAGYSYGGPCGYQSWACL